MKRKEIIERFKIKDSFLNLMITRATVLKDLKAGMGYANEYDERAVCFILIGWEMHKLGMSFRYINKVLSVWKGFPEKDFKKSMCKHGFLLLYSEQIFKKLSKEKQEKMAMCSWVTKQEVIDDLEDDISLGRIVINAKKIAEMIW